MKKLKTAQKFMRVKFSTYNAADRTLELILLFVLLFRCVYCLLKNLKSISIL